MTTYVFDSEKLAGLKGKTVLIIGAVSGIGRAALEITHGHGANVVFGDWNQEEGEKIVDEFKDRILFQKCDVSNFNNVLDLFESAWKKYGTIHAVLSNAGVNLFEGVLEDKYQDETGRLLAPDIRSIEVNLLGQIYVTKCALHYFKKWPGTRSQVVLTASAASFFPAPPIHMYCAAKSGVLGFMRALRSDATIGNATVNIVAPWLTLTPMVLPDWMRRWGTLPTNTCEGVAHALLLPVVEPQINGKAFFVAGNNIIEFEDSLLKTQPQWMGQQLSDDVNQGQEVLLAK